MTSGVVTHTGVLQVQPAVALGALLGVELGDVREGLPPMWHAIYLLDRWRRDELGVDGHPLHGMPEPPKTPHSRMFAGGRTQHVRPLAFGVETTKTSRVVKTVEKVGSSGPLTFVTVRHEFAQNGELVVSEEHDIVYRPLSAAPTNARAGVPRVARDEPAAPAPALLSEELRFAADPVALFLFSMYTSNSHRIHYDEAFAKSEGHAGLVIHGPLQILLMAAALGARGTELIGHEFAYRLLKPATGAQILTVGEPTDDDGNASVRVVDDCGTFVARGDVTAVN
ncbi:mesaconyl-C4 CoA hydratase [Subtercola endophyticus]|uniref:mesaconyl-C4 CoA hydratase n=1 Tax=Subtercola endophyticus TaxID=2895559 RepID=UPI001E3714ED|nr:mesaconyl-C4 CoA hydratase [Subtercola endophyticus]UFS58321.1 mesaconyl-C4 CoA hydratase [Subtercola endophyticus]